MTQRQWLWRIPGRGWNLEDDETEIVHGVKINGQWVATDVVEITGQDDRVVSIAPVEMELLELAMASLPDVWQEEGKVFLEKIKKADS